MLFMARCAFWLGLVAWQLPWPPLADEPSGAGDAMREASAQALTNVRHVLGDAPARLCIEAPGRCLAAARSVVLPAPATKPANVKPRLTISSFPAGARAVATSASANSLTPSDLQPKWTSPHG